MWQSVLRGEETLRCVMSWFGQWLTPLALRLIMAYEFWESGWEKLHGENWFGDLLAAGRFPVPFSWFSADVLWFLGTWLELGGAVLLIAGVGTRYVAATLMVLTAVATYAVHLPLEWHSLAELWQGYVITDEGHGNFKLPLLFLLLLLPLVTLGGGWLSVDYWVARRRGLV